MKRKHLLPLLIWTGLWSLFFLTILVGLQRLPTSDFTEQFHSFATFQASEMAEGRLPLWTPHSRGGLPFVADPQAAVFYLPRWLSILVSLPWGFSLLALEIEALVHIWLAGLFTYGLSYSITRNRQASLFAAVAFGLGGYLTSYPLLQLAILETIAWLPLILLLIREGVLRSGEKVRLQVGWFIGAALVLAIAITAGHPQTLMHVCYLAVAYYLFMTIRSRWRWTSIGIIGILMGILSIAISSPHWLPILRFFGESTRVSRAGADYGFTAVGQPMLNFVQVITPAVLTLWSPEYIGLAAVILLLLALIGRHVNKELRSEILFWFIVLLTTLWISLGDSGIIYQLLYYAAPGFSFFRQQERLIGLATLSGALLAAQGLSLWMRLDRELLYKLLRPVAIIVTMIIVIAAVILTAARPVAVSGWPLIVIRQIAIAILIFALLFFGRKVRVSVLLLTLILAGDLYLSTFSAVNRQDESPADYWLKPDWLDQFLEDYEKFSPSRINSNKLFWANIGEVYSWEDLSAINAIQPRFLDDMERLPTERMLQLLNVSHVIATAYPENIPHTPLFNFDGGLKSGHAAAGVVYRYDKPMPRAWMAYQSIIVENDDLALELLGSSDFDPATQVLISEQIPELEITGTSMAADQPPVVDVSSPQPGHLKIVVETAFPGFLVISEWSNPGWTATLDGEAVPLYRADYALQALWVPAGTNEVNLRYQPIEVFIGAIISIIAIGIAMLLAWRWRPALQFASGHSILKYPSVQIPRIQFSIMQGLDKRSRLWLLVALIFIGFGLRLFQLGEQELRGDEAISFEVTLDSAPEIVSSIRSRGNPHSPFHYLMLNGWLNLTGDSEFAMRSISVIPGLLAIPLMYVLGSQFGSWSFGFLLAFLTTIAQSLVWISQDVRNQYTLSIFFALLATLLLFRALRRPKWWWWALYAPAAALTVYAHYYGIFALMAHGVYLLTRSSTRREWAAWLASSFGAFLLFLPWFASSLPYMITQGRHFSMPSTPNLTRHITDVGIHLGIGTGVDTGIARWLFIGMVVLCFLGIRYLWRRDRPITTMLVFWLGATILGIYLVRFSREIFNNYYISIAGPAWWTLVAAGLISLWGRRGNVVRLIAILGLIAIILVQGTALANYYFDSNFNRTLGYNEVLNTLREESGSGDVIVANYPDASLTYYLKDLPIYHTMQPAIYQDADKNTDQSLKDLSSRYDRLWFVPVHRSTWDPEDVAFRWLDYHALLEQEGHYDQIILAAYRPLETADQVMYPVEQSLNQLISLEGAYMTVDGEPQPLFEESGVHLPVDSNVEVSLLWKSLGKIDESYTVFVHLLAEDGRLLAQHDGLPAFGTRPTPSWEMGERILDKHRFSIPPDLDVAGGGLVVGLYKSDDQERQVFDSGTEQIWLADVEISPGSNPR